LNFAANCVKELLEAANYYDSRPPQDVAAVGLTGVAEEFRGVASDIERCQHFQLPANGVVFDDALRGLIGRPLHLPYPEITLEFETPEALAEGRAGKVLMACFERETGIYTLPCTASPEVGWSPSSVGIWAPFEQPSLSCTGSEREITCECATWIAMPNLYRTQAPNVKRDLGHALEDRIPAFLSVLFEFVECISCSNITATPIQVANPRINADRARRGKIPLLTTSILTLRPSGPRKQGTAHGGHHESPRQHLVRGHVRGTPSGGTTWIPSFARGDASLGKVTKSYVIKKE
jgi:hypothetical protein